MSLIIEHRFAKIENDLAVLKWIVTTVIGISLVGFSTGATLLLRILSALPTHN